MKRSEKNRILKSAIEVDSECKRIVRKMKKTDPTSDKYAELVDRLLARKQELREALAA